MAAALVSWFVGDGITYLGLVPAALGFVIVGWAVRAMGPSITPFPTPSPRAHLVRDGPFRFVRHPIYVGGVLVFAGLSLVFSAWGLLVTAALAVFWVAKARHEERLLLERFAEYAEYRRRTPF